MLRFHRNDGSTSPATAENVDLADDGRFTGWRSIAPVVGWFAGELPTSECEELRTAIAGLDDAVPDPPPPGASVETLELPARDPLVVSGVEGDGPLGRVVDRARRLLDDMVGSPRAAVALEAGSPPRLVHRGTDPIELDLSTVAMHAHHWRGYYEPAGEATEVLSGQRVEAGPGWTLDLPSLPAAPSGSDITTHLTVDLAIVAGGNVVPVQVQHLPAIAEPPG
jgi:hypothetical protein